MKIHPSIAFACIALALSSCNSTKLVSSWRDPSVTVNEAQLKKVLMIALIKDQPTRKKAEDRLAELFGIHGEASYNYLGNDVMAINTPGITDRMAKDGIDGVMIMRVVDRSKEESYVPGAPMPEYYDSVDEYYGAAAPMFNDPGYIKEDMTLVVETNVYSTRLNKLVWTGTTSTMNPNGLASTLHDIMEVVHARMSAEGFLQQTP